MPMVQDIGKSLGSVVLIDNCKIAFIFFID